jgi:hypothetical protein
MDMLQQAHDDTLASVKTIDDPAERVRAINEAIRRGSALHIELAEIKRQTVRQMVSEIGATATAAAIGVTLGRVTQLVEGKK